MKKWLYFIIPAICTAAFLFFYFSHVEQAEAALLAKKEAIAKQDAEDKARKAALEERARIDADKKSKERAEEDAKKEADKAAKWAADGKKIEDERSESIKIGSDHTAKINLLEKEIAALRAKKDQSNRDFLEQARQVELAKIERRNAELEVQRLTTFVTRKAEEAAISKDPTPVAPVAPVAK